MGTEKLSISRKIALKRLGRLSLGLLFATSTVQSALAQNASGPGRKPFSNSKPNILWITTEGVPLKVLSCYGSTLIQTPNIDRIAKEGMLFSNSFVTIHFAHPAGLHC